MTYTTLQTQYLDAVDALLSTQADALEARQQLELLTGLSLRDVPETETKPVDVKLSDETMKKLDEIFPGPGGTAPEAYAW